MWRTLVRKGNKKIHKLFKKLSKKRSLESQDKPLIKIWSAKGRLLKKSCEDQLQETSPCTSYHNHTIPILKKKKNILIIFQSKIFKNKCGIRSIGHKIFLKIQEKTHGF